MQPTKVSTKTMWRGAKAYTRGVRHAQEGLPCQDFADYRIRKMGPNKTPIFLGCAADGAGFASHAHQGAQAAVRLMIGHFSALIAAGLTQDIPALEKCLFQALARIENKQQQLAQRFSLEPEAFATTLLFILATPSCFFSAQIGDGIILVRPQGQAAYTLLFTPQKGAHINETFFLPLGGGKKGVQHTYVETPVDFCLLATDGIENVSLDLKNWQPHGGFFGPLERHMAASPSSRKAEYDLRKFLRNEKLHRRNQDDKTIVIGLKRPL